MHKHFYSDQTIKYFNNGKVIIINCSFSKGVDFTVKKHKDKKIAITDCIFEKSCVINSNMKSCKYDKDGILTISKSQESPTFEINKIKIFGKMNSINLFESQLIINSTGSLVIVSMSGSGIRCIKSVVNISNSGQIYLHSNFSNTLFINNSALVLRNFENFRLYSPKSAIDLVTSITSISNNSQTCLYLEDLHFFGRVQMRIDNKMEIETDSLFTDIELTDNISVIGEMTLSNFKRIETVDSSRRCIKYLMKN